MELSFDQVVAIAGAFGGAALVAFRTTVLTVTARARAVYVAAGAAVGAAVAALTAALVESVK